MELAIKYRPLIFQNQRLKKRIRKPYFYWNSKRCNRTKHILQQCYSRNSTKLTFHRCGVVLIMYNHARSKPLVDQIILIYQSYYISMISYRSRKNATGKVAIAAKIWR